MGITLESYQANAVDWLKNKKRGIVVASAGSGKTIIAAAALQQVILTKPRLFPVKVGWMAHTIEQCQQARDALEKFPCSMETNVECAAAENDWSDRDVLVVDEVHHSPSPSWFKQVQSCPGARWGFTATPFGDDLERNEVLLNLFDRNMLTIDRSEVGQRLVPAKVVMLDASDADLESVMNIQIERDYDRRIRWWKGEDWKLRAIITWQVCIKRGIVGNATRNYAAVSLARWHAADSVLVLVNEIDHGKELAERIPGARLCYSKMGAKLRRETLEAFKSGEIHCVVATSLADEGLDIPIANVLILVSGGRSSAKTEQRTGRVLRAFAGKERGTIYDFLDGFHATMANHSRKRMAVYRKLGYSIQMP